MSHEKGSFGHTTYAQFLATCKKPATVSEVCEATGAKTQTVREILWRMERLGLVHVTGWSNLAGRSGSKHPLFRAGEGESVPYPRPLNRLPFGACKGSPRSELVAFAAIVRMLRDGATRKEIHEQTGVAYMRVSNLLRAMRAHGLIHTGAWLGRESGFGSPTEVLVYGPGKNAPRPPTQSRADIHRRYRQRKLELAQMLMMIHATAANIQTERLAA